MSNNIYDILDKLKNLSPAQEKPAEATKEPVYESVEARGDIMEAVKQLEEKYMGFKKTVAAIKKGGSAEDPEAVAASIGRKKYGKKAFQKAAAKGEKLGEDTVIRDESGKWIGLVGHDDQEQPDRLSAEDDGEEVKESKKEYCDACDSTECHCDDKVEEGIEDRIEAAREKAAAKGKIKDKELDAKKPEASRTVKGTRYGGSAQHEEPEADDMDEGLTGAAIGGTLGALAGGPIGAAAGGYIGHKVQQTYSKEKALKAAQEKNWAGKKVAEVAPPGAKAERMVKHIKKGYAKDGELTDKEKSIAYATAWKAHKAGKVEEGTEFGDTIANSKAELKPADKLVVKEGRSLMTRNIRHDPIYTDKEAWDHYKKELDEQATGEVVLDAQQELDEIARLAGLPAKHESKCMECGMYESSCECVDESKCPSCGCADCKCETINEAATRKDFRMVADLIKNIPDAAKRKELADHHSAIFKQQNPRFDKDVFCKACGLDEGVLGTLGGAALGAALGGPVGAAVGAVGGQEATKGGSSLIEKDIEEGNEFTKARLDAIAAGKDSFTVGGKTFKVTGDTTDEKGQVDESVTVNITATDEDVVGLMQRLAGLPVIAVAGHQSPEAEVHHCEVDEERDVEWSNTPKEQTAPISAAIPSGNDLHKAKQQDPATANKAANPLAEEQDVFENLWTEYQTIISDVKTN